MDELPPAPGLYVHLPFCARRCDYCAFASTVYDAARAERYLAALAKEWEYRRAGWSFRTVFLGGGTPTALPPESLARLLGLFASAARDVAEWSVEANPGAFSARHADVLAAAGVNRISFGAQTFQPRGLAALGRRQDPGDALGAVRIARAAGIPRVGVDLIAGWPGQTLADWDDDLAQALALEPEHISAYGLSVEPETPLAARVAAGACAAPDEAFDRDAWDRAGDVLAAAGLARYEISNHARPGAECVHHLNYWTGGAYLGLGAAAHSHEAGVRRANVAEVDAYIAAWEAFDGSAGREEEAPGPGVAFEEMLPPERKARETLTVWLRLADGVDIAAFRRRTGFDLVRLIARELPGLIAQGGLAWSEDGTRLRLTPRAFPVADAVLSELV